MKENSLVLVDKPAEMSSFGVVARVRRVWNAEFGHKVKVGHTGTLDPFATGLLVLLTGKMTKRAMELTKLDKIYEAEMVLGAVSTTGDPEGEMTPCETKGCEKEITRVGLEEALAGFVGEIEQVPPAFSAIKVNGQRAYKLARAGKAVEMPKRKVKIYDIQLLEFAYPVVKFRVFVSSGTYIRTLAEDIGKKLGTGAYLRALRRTQVGEFSVEDAKSLADLSVTS